MPSSPYLWQCHAVHHAPEHLDWLVNTRAHPVNIIVTRLGALVPLYLFGWLEQVIVTPMFHHWHHTNDQHRDRNFAATLPMVDRLFGRFRLPDEWPTIYGVDRPIASTLSGELVLPFLPPRSSPAPVEPALR